MESKIGRRKCEAGRKLRQAAYSIPQHPLTTTFGLSAAAGLAVEMSTQTPRVLIAIGVNAGLALGSFFYERRLRRRMLQLPPEKE